MKPPIVIAVLAMASCAPRNIDPHNVLVLCDGSGDRAAVCSHEALLSVVQRWARRAAARPGSTFTVIASASDFANTKVSVSIMSPPLLASDPKRAQAELIDRAAGAIGSLDIPRDTKEDRRKSVSDGIAGIALSSRIMLEEDMHDVDLVVMGDGLWVSPGIVNAERTAPSGDDVFSRAKEAGFDIDLGRVRTVLACGLGTSGMTAAQVAARDDMVVGFFKAAGAPAPVVRSSCAKGLVLP